MADSFVFSTRGLSIGYQGKQLIRDIEVSLQKGQILTLIGPNGAGKSTLLKTITRQLTPIAGTVYIGQSDLKTLPAGDLARRMAVVLTERVRPEMMTCFDVAAMGRYPYTGRFGTLTAEDRQIVGAALARVRAEDIADRDFNRVSDGQRHTVILSLHEIDLAEKNSDLVMCVQGDTVRQVGPPEEIFSDAAIVALYGLDEGAYLTRRGSIELSKPAGAPRVFVLGGAGAGLPHYRRLQRARVPFAAGILFENDLEYDVARALAARVISQPAFTPMGPEAVEAAREAILSCGVLLDAGAPQGLLNSANAALIAFAKEKGIRVIRHADELD